MKSSVRQYLFASIFIALGIYYGIKKDFLEFFLYTIAGLAFFVNVLTLEPKFAAYKKILVIITWVLIVSACIVFLYVLQFKF